ncbi:MAG: TetR/AcrR family transcriptional regulator [Alphaproteobacteria bacterium]|nr:TetR/AcrR family transcriptional regulator [Alphaproteobacteria bacterium]
MNTDPRLSTPPPKPKPSRGRGRPVGDREAKRKELLAAGVRVIARAGYGGASLRKVAQEAGHTTGAVNYYFENKDAMVRDIVEHMFDAFDDILADGDRLADIKPHFERWLALSSDSDIWLASFQLLAVARHEPALAAIYQKRYARYRKILAGILARQQAAGAIRSDVPPDVLADHLGAIGDGWMMMMPIEPRRFTPARVKLLLDALVALLRPAPGASGSSVSGLPAHAV